MKKILCLLIVALCATMFPACSDEDEKDPLNEDEEGGEGVITMITEDDTDWYLSVYSFNKGDIITIDWGDGTIEEFKTVLNEDEYYDEEEDPETIRYWTDYLQHKYSNDNPHTITIKGNISGLDCNENNLSSLDVSKCTKLTYLECDENNLSSLDVSKNTELTVLRCFDNNLSSLDVSKCTKLTYLECDENNLSSLDVSKNTELTYLVCGDKLSSLDVSKNIKLTVLSCGDNNLTSIDVSKCTKLTHLGCWDNKLSSSALNKIFGDLPQVENGYIYIPGNPGSDTCDRSIAENKGWDVRDDRYY